LRTRIAGAVKNVRIGALTVTPKPIAVVLDVEDGLAVQHRELIWLEGLVLLGELLLPGRRVAIPVTQSERLGTLGDVRL
jgi:hypothetical protein